MEVPELNISDLLPLDESDDGFESRSSVSIPMPFDSSTPVSLYIDAFSIFFAVLVGGIISFIIIKRSLRFFSLYIDGGYSTHNNQFLDEYYSDRASCETVWLEKQAKYNLDYQLWHNRIVKHEMRKLGYDD